MSRLVARAENWERVYTAFQSINFAAFDFTTIKQSILEYVKLYFPETFNDYIETSEFIAIVESFAYIAELLAYRLDINAHENFLSTAQRKDSVLRLAKFISYTASRPIPSRGLVKITSVRTTESVSDANGTDLAGQTITWNDTTNTNWKDQFIMVMNRVLEQDFGTVGPTERFQIQDVLFELYALNLVPLTNGVFTYSATVGGKSVPMELVPVAYSSDDGIVERRPVNNGNFSILYGQDGVGDSSNTTGFFCYTKQGTLQRLRTTFDGVTPNQTYDITTSNINDTDVWVNNVDSSTGETLDETSTLPYRTATLSGRSGEWVEVDLAHAQNVIFNTNPKRNKYELETLANNQVRVIFGDGEFADVPSGTFDIWARSSLDEDLAVPRTAVVNKTATFTYIDAMNKTQTFTFTYSLVNSLQNGSASEDIEHIRANAPAVYYSQDRMVNGQDYNTFPLQDPSILKLRSVNRTFAGDSKYITWHDASGTYENVKIFGDDGRLYFQDIETSETTASVDTNVLISTYLEPLLSATDIEVQILTAGVAIGSFNRSFTTDEKTRISYAISSSTTLAAFDMYYNTSTYEWYVVKTSQAVATAIDVVSGSTMTALGWPSSFITTPLLSVSQVSNLDTKYTVTRTARRIIFESPSTAFWNTNEATRVIDYDTLDSTYDEIVVLQANINSNKSGVLSQNWSYYVLGQEVIDSGSDTGLADTSRLSILPVDESNTGVPQGLDVNDATTFAGVANIFKPKISMDISSLTIPSAGYSVTLPIYYCTNTSIFDDVVIYAADGTTVLAEDTYWTRDTTAAYSNTIKLLPALVTAGHSSILITVNEYVYFTRANAEQAWTPVDTSTESISSYVVDRVALYDSEQAYAADPSVTLYTPYWTRRPGRAALNFAWFHRCPRYYLVDPSPSNIIDMYVITKGYYLELKRWLEGSSSTKPSQPTPLDLRSSYSYMLDNKMISDTVVLRPGIIKLIFGSNAASALQATFKVVKASTSTMTDNQVKTTIVTTIRSFFDISQWEFGETFYFTELVAAIHAALPNDISSVVIVPVLTSNHFGNLFQITAREDEVLYPDITVDDITIVTGLTATNINITS